MFTFLKCDNATAFVGNGFSASVSSLNLTFTIPPVISIFPLAIIADRG